MVRGIKMTTGNRLRDQMKTFVAPTGQEYKLDHLKPVDYQIPVTIEDVKYIVPVVVTYSPHCFSDGKRGSVQPTDPWFYTTDSTGHRVFCTTRWNSSLNLPAHVGALINNKLYCYAVHDKGNYVHLRNPNPKFPGNGWYVFFDLKNPTGSGPAIVHMYISSHHLRPDFPPSIRGKKTFRFPALLAKWIRDKEPLHASLKAGNIPGTVPVTGVAVAVTGVAVPDMKK